MSDGNDEEEPRDLWLRIAGVLHLPDPNWREVDGVVVVTGSAGPDEVAALAGDLADRLLPAERQQLDDIAHRLRFAPPLGPDGMGRVTVVCRGWDVSVTCPDLLDAGPGTGELASLYRRALAQYREEIEAPPDEP